MSTGPLPIRTRLRPLPAPAPRRGVRAVFRGPLAGALCGLLLASGCGVLPGGGDDESPVMTWAPLRTTGTNAPGMTAMARAYEQWVNSGGGIGGRELRVLVCDEGNESVAAAECARRAVREKAVAVVGSYSEQDAAIFSPISLAGIPYLGGYGITHEEFVNPDSYPVNGGLPALIAAQGAQLAPDCDRVALVRPEGVTGDTWPDLLRAGLRGAGGKGEVVDLPVPVSSSDYTPQAGQVLDRLAPAPAARRCVSVALGDSTAAFVDSFRRVAPSGGTGTGGAEAGAGSTGAGATPAVRVGSVLGSVSQRLVDRSGGVSGPYEGAAVTGWYPPASDPRWATMKKVITRHAFGDNAIDPADAGVQTTWIAYTALRRIVESLGEGPVTARTVRDALDKGTKVSTGGLTPTLSWGDDYARSVIGYPRTANTRVTHLEVRDGQLVAAQGTGDGPGATGDAREALESEPTGSGGRE
ncbi:MULTISPECIES: ABC transporter substrate-binding protein [Streptomyces]|uniref:ABC transporter substrate-binding protein n=1 Tax=Streptomyces evansiae TaxID=3075535 RepID=A0ABU2R9E8_9ACTN|nr:MULTISPECIES: ABC transporter substrate-binding protein [unclassified Streptomyces]MDT0412714.1 ABC transporter substrate-binding protein [Streptomyces sp. DSM 41979]MYQ60980.1 ABC transporter substrate-binding protein [Streptomyces sp. SID4926]